jgi:hypothetical protein
MKGSHLADILTESFKYPATTTDNFIAAAMPAINAKIEKTATISPRRNPLITAITRNIITNISMIIL